MLTDKTIIISGVGPGLGQALARVAAAEGARVVLAARSPDYLEEVVAAIVAAGGQAIAQSCDVRDDARCQALAEAAAAFGGGRIDGLVNSAYLHGAWSGVEDADADDFAQVYDVSCLGALRLTRACVPHLSGGGAVVNVSTMATVRPYGGEHGMEMGYAVAKAGLNTLGKYMAADLGRHGIRVNTCRLGWIDGAPVRSFIDAQVAAGADEAAAIGDIVKDIPLGQIPSEEDCARAVLTFVSDSTRAVTGATLDVNGGQWMAP